ncbi:hypothetical protein JST97_18625 [bacterium]|nr:hypothetical protein [bacterium]
MKPNTKTAVANLIREARQELPFQLSLDGHCEGRCEECAFKLLEFLEMDLSYWESRLKRGDTPSLGDVHALASDCRRVYEILQVQGLILPP